MSDSNSIIRVQKNRDNPYVILDKTFINDKRLSFKAKGILVYLLSKPDNWKIKPKDLVNQSNNGRDAVYSGLNELIDNGYIVRKETRYKGKFIAIEYTVHECPQIIGNYESEPFPENPEMENPEMNKPEMDNPDTDNPDINNNNLSNNDFNNKTTTKKFEITESSVTDFKNKIEKLLDAPMPSKLLRVVLEHKGPEAVEFYIRNIRSIIAGQKIENIVGFFVSAVMKEYKIPKSHNGKAPQFLNFEQREYSEDYWNRIYSIV